MLEPISFPTPYPDINAMLRELLDSIQNVLGSHFIGMYLDGSLAAGGFDSASDIDFLVVTDEDIAGDLFLGLQAMHDRINKMDSVWAIQLEGSYVSLHAVRRYDPEHALHPCIERGLGERLKMAVHDGWFAVHRHVLLKSGIPLVGPALHTLIDPVSADELRQVVLTILGSWVEHFPNHPEDLSFAPYQCYLVLSICRALYTLQFGTVVSKLTAADWARETLPDPWKVFVEQAWIGRITPKEKATAEEIQATLNFISYAVEVGRPFKACLQCEICSQLKEVETSLSKYGWEEMDRPLPAAAARLVTVEPLTDYDPEHHHIKRCPLCGTRYQYDLTYEYLVNGSEDEERLARLYPSIGQPTGSGFQDTAGSS